jgi:hypothetical protein
VDEIRRALISSGRLAPGRRVGSRKVLAKTTTALSRLQHGPKAPHRRQRPVALDVVWVSSSRCASLNCCSAEVA